MATLKYTMETAEGIRVNQLLIQYVKMDLEQDSTGLNSYKSHSEYSIQLIDNFIRVFLDTDGNVMIGEQVIINLEINGKALIHNPVVFVVPASGKIYQTIKVLIP